MKQENAPCLMHLIQKPELDIYRQMAIQMEIFHHYLTMLQYLPRTIIYTKLNGIIFRIFCSIPFWEQKEKTPMKLNLPMMRLNYSQATGVIFLLRSIA